MMESHGLLPWAALYTVLWCVVHSLLLSHKTSGHIKRVAGSFAGWYRFAYNIIALITLSPLLLYLQTVQEPPVIKWSGWCIAIRAVLLITAILLFYGGSRTYDFRTFLGISQIRTGKDNILLSADTTFQREGILGIIRHPWYTGGILLLWTMREQYGRAVIVIYSILTAYLFIGAFVEEWRLRGVFGQDYEKYRAEVSMFFPVKWIVKWMGGKANR